MHIHGCMFSFHVKHEFFSITNSLMYFIGKDGCANLGFILCTVKLYSLNNEFIRLDFFSYLKT